MTDHDLYTARIEKVARALYEDMPLRTGELPSGKFLVKVTWDGLAEGYRDGYWQKARAADKAVLEAIREPTEEMLKHGMFALGLFANHGPHTGYSCTADAVYAAIHGAIPRGET